MHPGQWHGHRAGGPAPGIRHGLEQQLIKNLTSDKRASGIGLYLCRRICRNLRHEIRIESAPGAGTTVRLTLGRPAFVAE